MRTVRIGLSPRVPGFLSPTAAGASRMAAALLAPALRAWSPALLPSGPGDQLLGVQRQWPPCQALVQWQGLGHLPLGRRRVDVTRHAVVVACDRKQEETDLEILLSALRTVVSIIFVLFNAVIRVATAACAANPNPHLTLTLTLTHTLTLALALALTRSSERPYC